MANFKTHISWGVIIAIALVVFGLIGSFVSGFELMALVFLAVLVGSFLPDLDSDGGLPFQIVFGLAGLVLAGMCFYYFFQNGERDWKILGGFSVGVFILVRFILGYFFEKLTRHRGIFHSVPAGVLFGLLTIWILQYFSLDFYQKLILGGAVFVGYLGHLILDEVYSTVNLRGFSILPKKSLGSALKFWSSSKSATLLVYFLIIFLFFNI
jgi:membrane-bound metal-dependent hydrolase YbcI (DUF457 family)